MSCRSFHSLFIAEASYCSCARRVIYIHIYILINICMMYVYIYVFIYLYLYLCVYVRIYMYVCMINDQTFILDNKFIRLYVQIYTSKWDISREICSVTTGNCYHGLLRIIWQIFFHYIVRYNYQINLVVTQYFCVGILFWQFIFQLFIQFIDRNFMLRFCLFIFICLIQWESLLNLLAYMNMNICTCLNK